MFWEILHGYGKTTSTLWTIILEGKSIKLIKIITPIKKASECDRFRQLTPSIIANSALY